jgi:hypothetical protein
MGLQRKIRPNTTGPSFLFFFAFFRKKFTNAPLLERFQKMDPDLGAMDCGAELTRHGAEMVQFLASVCVGVLDRQPTTGSTRSR